jgi:hypothetical protein
MEDDSTALADDRHRSGASPEQFKHERLDLNKDQIRSLRLSSRELWNGALQFELFHVDLDASPKYTGKHHDPTK